MDETEVAYITLFVPHTYIARFSIDRLLSKQGDYSIPFLIY